jgi:glutathione synthase/RimK-type ligase-like ATP-grasp enzyme
MKKIAILSSKIILGFFEPKHPKAQAHALHERGASAGDLSHFTLDYEALTHSLAKHELAYELVAWNDAEINWADFDAVLIHTPWDYYENKSAFMETLRRIESQSLLLNAFDTVSWNFDKRYLNDAQNYGIQVIETTFVDPERVDDLLNEIPSHYWKTGCIMKPAVSAGAADLYWVKSPEEAEVLYRTHFKNKHETLMIQPFREEIKTEGEWSFIFLNGSYSHGVLKKTLEEGIGVKHSTQH